MTPALVALSRVARVARHLPGLSPSPLLDLFADVVDPADRAARAKGRALDPLDDPLLAPAA